MKSIKKISLPESFDLTALLKNVEEVSQTNVQLSVCMQGQGWWAQLVQRGRAERLGSASNCQTAESAILSAVQKYLKKGK